MPTYPITTNIPGSEVTHYHHGEPSLHAPHLVEVGDYVLYHSGKALIIYSQSTGSARTVPEEGIPQELFVTLFGRASQSNISGTDSILGIINSVNPSQEHLLIVYDFDRATGEMGEIRVFPLGSNSKAIAAAAAEGEIVLGGRNSAGNPVRWRFSEISVLGGVSEPNLSQYMENLDSTVNSQIAGIEYYQEDFYLIERGSTNWLSRRDGDGYKRIGEIPTLSPLTPVATVIHQETLLLTGGDRLYYYNTNKPNIIGDGELDLGLPTTIIDRPFTSLASNDEEVFVAFAKENEEGAIVESYSLENEELLSLESQTDETTIDHTPSQELPTMYLVQATEFNDKILVVMMESPSSGYFKIAYAKFDRDTKTVEYSIFDEIEGVEDTAAYLEGGTSRVVELYKVRGEVYLVLSKLRLESEDPIYSILRLDSEDVLHLEAEIQKRDSNPDSGMSWEFAGYFNERILFVLNRSQAKAGDNWQVFDTNTKTVTQFPHDIEGFYLRQGAFYSNIFLSAVNGDNFLFADYFGAGSIQEVDANGVAVDDSQSVNTRRRSYNYYLGQIPSQNIVVIRSTDGNGANTGFFFYQANTPVDFTLLGWTPIPQPPSWVGSYYRLAPEIIYYFNDLFNQEEIIIFVGNNNNVYYVVKSELSGEAESTPFLISNKFPLLEGYSIAVIKNLTDSALLLRVTDADVSKKVLIESTASGLKSSEFIS